MIYYGYINQGGYLMNIKKSDKLKKCAIEIMKYCDKTKNCHECCLCVDGFCPFNSAPSGWDFEYEEDE